MAQLALPYRIALAAMLVLVVAWFAVLRPKDEASTGAPAPAAAAPAASSSGAQAPGVAGLGRAVSKAQGAVATSQRSAQATEAAVGGTAAATPSATAATPSATAAKPAAPTATPATPAAARLDSGDRSGPVLSALAHGRVAVVLFSNRQAADDAHVRAVLHRIDRHHGKVGVWSASINDVGRYSAITRGVEILQGPTLLVIGQDRKARTIVGFTDRAEIDQLVDDVGHFRA